jgi:hypothetical protein
MGNFPARRSGEVTIRRQRVRGIVMKVVILAGGYGTRISEETALRP